MPRWHVKSFSCEIRFKFVHHRYAMVLVLPQEMASLRPGLRRELNVRPNCRLLQDPWLPHGLRPANHRASLMRVVNWILLLRRGQWKVIFLLVSLDLRLFLLWTNGATPLLVMWLEISHSICIKWLCKSHMETYLFIRDSFKGEWFLFLQVWRWRGVHAHSSKWPVVIWWTPDCIKKVEWRDRAWEGPVLCPSMGMILRPSFEIMV